MVCLSRPYHFKYFKDCLPQISLVPYLKFCSIWCLCYQLLAHFNLHWNDYFWKLHTPKVMKRLWKIHLLFAVSQKSLLAKKFPLVLFNLFGCSLTNGYLQMQIYIFFTTKIIYHLADDFIKKSMKFCVIFFILLEYLIIGYLRCKCFVPELSTFLCFCEIHSSTSVTSS